MVEAVPFERTLTEFGGEAGRLIAGRNWLLSPLGPIQGWPQTLKDALGLILPSPVPIVMLWGKDGIMLYNDAYSIFAGGRHPKLLGAKVREGWPEVADFNDNVMKVGFTGKTLAYRDHELTLYRHGRPEQVWMNLDYSPILDERGHVLGVVAVVIETTERVLAERRAATERERLFQAFEQVPGFIVAMRGPDHRVEFVNAAHRQVFGSQDWIGKPIRQAFPDIGGQGFFEILDGVFASGERYLADTVPVSFRQADGAVATRYLSFVYDAMRDADGRIAGVLCEGSDVTAAHLARSALSASEARFRTALEIRTVGAINFNLDGQLSDANDAFLRMSGYSRADLNAGRLSLQSLTAPEWRSTVDRTLAELRDTGETTPVQKEYVRADGSRWWGLFAAKRLPDGSGFKFVVDITEQKTADARRQEIEAELRNSESRLRIAQAAGQIGTFELLPESGQILVSEQFCRLWGVPYKPQFATAEFIALIEPEDRALVQTDSPQIGSKTLDYLEYRVRRPDTGEVRWMARRGEVINDDLGRRRYLGVSYDITERKRAELALRKLNETLEAQVAERTAERDRMWKLSAELMLVANFEAKIVAVNPAWSTVLGYAPGELDGRNFMELVHPEDVETTLSEVGRLAEGATTFAFENRYRHKDGSWRTLAWTAVPDAGFIHAVARDVTEERIAAESLRRTEEALRQAQKMEAVGQLTGGIAHDFNNMLAIVIGSLDLAKRRLDRNQAPDRYLENAREGALRAATLTQRLLAFSRQQPLSPKVISLNRLVGSMSELLRRTLGEQIELETVLAGGLWRINADPHQMESALVNLAVNARDAMPQGGKLTIETANAHLDENYVGSHLGLDAGQYVMVAVSDHGSGMSPDVLARVFDPFFTTKPVGKGTGLGLSMVYGFAKQSGGHVAIYSEPGVGTTVKMYLPRHLGMLDEDTGGQTAPLADSDGTEVILVVEDDERVRQMSVEALMDLGYIVYQASGGEEALKLVETLPRLDLLFTDIVMAGMTGRELAAHVHARAPHVKVLYTTGYTRNAVVHNGVLDPGVEFLAKPFRIADLATKVRSVLDQYP